jgi:hypothetical protein
LTYFITRGSSLFPCPLISPQTVVSSRVDTKH